MSHADTALWSRVVDGDTGAFAVFYRRHSGRVFSHCYARAGSQPDAEDLTAEVFAITWHKREKIVPHSDVDILPWLLTTANHLLRRHYSSVRSARRLLAHLPRERGLPDIAERIAQEAHDEFAIAKVNATLAQLRIGDREIIELCVIQGLTPGAVAAATARSPGTVRSQLSRALNRARAAYARADSAHSGGPHRGGGTG